MVEMDRAKVLMFFAQDTGREVPAAYLRETRRVRPDAGVDQFHSLISGIYKPAWSDLALCIKVGLDSPYSDEIRYLPDGRWTLQYSARVGGLAHSDNRALMKCLERGAPVGVVVQTRRKQDPRGVGYRIQGLALVRDYDAATDRFTMEGATRAALDSLVPQEDPVGREEMLLLANLTNAFVPTVSTRREMYTANRLARDPAFRNLILRQYEDACAVCRGMFRLRRPAAGPLVEAEAAHIRAVEEEGTDDLRNGVSLCRRHHWAFDQGLFTINEDHRVIVSGAVGRADKRNFDLEDYHGKPTLPPVNEACRPHEDVLRWHIENRFQS